MRYGDDEMKEVFSKLFEKLINEKKGFKIITWIFGRILYFYFYEFFSFF